MASWRPSIFEYVDYRAYLRDYYEAGKANLASFSYRDFSRRAGFSSPNFLKLVIDKKRNLGRESIDQVAEAMGMDGEEQHFFANLVAFNQADSDADRNRYYEQLAASRRFREARQLDGALFDYLSHWYYPAIREMVARPDFREDPVWIASELVPQIKPAEASTALGVLMELGLVERDSTGRLSRGEQTITSGHEVRALGVTNYHRQMLERAADSIEAVPSEQRDLSAMTVCVGRRTVPELKRRLQEFREQFMAFCDDDPDPEVVYQINIQLFPMSRHRGEIE